MNIITCDPDELKSLTLLVHPSAARLSEAAHRLREARVWPLLYVSRIVGPCVESPRGHLAHVIRHRLEIHFADDADTPIILDSIALLFEPTLNIDPLHLLNRMARIRRLIVAWPGTVTGSTLAYAVPEHHHYRTWPAPEATIIPL